MARPGPRTCPGARQDLKGRHGDGLPSGTFVAPGSDGRGRLLEIDRKASSQGQTRSQRLRQLIERDVAEV